MIHAKTKPPTTATITPNIVSTINCRIVVAGESLSGSLMTGALVHGDSKSYPYNSYATD
ncbi:MAG: hypothetical protein QME49_06705 [bacterium]|nr:hypothetical protein [bacterium]